MESFGGERNHLAPVWPTPMLLISYPFFAINVRILCEEEWAQARGKSSLVTLINSLNLVYQTEGLKGIYRGAHLFLLHHVLSKGVCRCIVDGCLQRVGSKQLSAQVKASRSPQDQEIAKLGIASEHDMEGLQDLSLADSLQHCWWWLHGTCSSETWGLHEWPRIRRVFWKYAIDVFCYPLLLATARIIVLHCDEPGDFLQHTRSWCREEGMLCLFKGVSCSVLSSAIEEVVDGALSARIEHCTSVAAAEGCVMEMPDKMLLKSCASSVVSVFTGPFNYVASIQRCTSPLPRLLSTASLGDTILSLPWMSSIQQLVLQSGILLLSILSVMGKSQQKAEEAGDEICKEPRDLGDVNGMAVE